MTRQLKASRGTGGDITAGRKVTIAIRIAATRSDVCWVENVAVYEVQFVCD